MKYYYKFNLDNKDPHINYPPTYKEYIFYADIPKQYWRDETEITWACSDKFTYTTEYKAFKVNVLDNRSMKNLELITEAKAFLELL